MPTFVFHWKKNIQRTTQGCENNNTLIYLFLGLFWNTFNITRHGKYADWSESKRKVKKSFCLHKPFTSYTHTHMHMMHIHTHRTIHSFIEQTLIAYMSLSLSASFCFSCALSLSHSSSTYFEGLSGKKCNCVNIMGCVFEQLHGNTA